MSAVVSSPGPLTAWQLVGILQSHWFGGMEVVRRVSSSSRTCTHHLTPGVRGSSPCAEAVLCRISGSFMEHGGLTAFQSPGCTLVRSGISCLVSLLTSLYLNSVQNRAVTSPVHSERCYSKIAGSCSGSCGLPLRCVCGSAGSVLPKPLAEG